MQRLEASAVAADTELVGGLGVQAEVHTHRFLFLRDPEAHGLVDGQGNDGRQDRGVRNGDSCCCELRPQLGESSAVEQAATHAVGGQCDEAQGNGADDAGDEVDADDVERVIEAPAELESHGKGGRYAGYHAEAEGTDGADVGTGR